MNYRLSWEDYWRIMDSEGRLAEGWTVRRSNPDGEEVFHTHPDGPWNPPSLLHMGTGSFSRG